MMAGVFSFFSRRRSPSLPHADWLVVGLGNPGPKYETTRHNVGFLTVDALADSFSSTPGVKASHALHQDCLLLKPQTFMNVSGEAVGPVVRQLELPLERIIVVHDELDLPAGVVRIKKGGNENGHNGLKSISETLGSRDYIRVRIGIGRPVDGQSISDWVLSPIDEDPPISTAAQAVELIADEGLTKAQNVIHAQKN